MKKRGERQFPEAGVVKEWPTYSVYTGTQPSPAFSGLWKKETAEGLSEHAMSPEGTIKRRAARGEYGQV